MPPIILNTLALRSSEGVGHLIYANGATLLAVPFDPDRLETIGSVVPIVTDVAAEITTGTGKFDVSKNGTLIYLKARASVEALRTLQWVDLVWRRRATTVVAYWRHVVLSIRRSHHGRGVLD